MHKRQLRDTPVPCEPHLTAGHMGKGSVQNVLERGCQQPFLDPDQVLQGEKVELIRQMSGHLLKLF